MTSPRVTVILPSELVTLLNADLQKQPLSDVEVKGLKRARSMSEVIVSAAMRGLQSETQTVRLSDGETVGQSDGEIVWDRWARGWLSLYGQRLSAEDKRICLDQLLEDLKGWFDMAQEATGDTTNKDFNEVRHGYLQEAIRGLVVSQESLSGYKKAREWETWAKDWLGADSPYAGPFEYYHQALREELDERLRSTDTPESIRNEGALAEWHLLALDRLGLPRPTDIEGVQGVRNICALDSSELRKGIFKQLDGWIHWAYSKLAADFEGIPEEERPEALREALDRLMTSNHESAVSLNNDVLGWLTWARDLTGLVSDDFDDRSAWTGGLRQDIETTYQQLRYLRPIYSGVQTELALWKAWAEGLTGLTTEDEDDSGTYSEHVVELRAAIEGKLGHTDVGGGIYGGAPILKSESGSEASARNVAWVDWAMGLLQDDGPPNRSAEELRAAIDESLKDGASAKAWTDWAYALTSDLSFSDPMGPKELRTYIQDSLEDYRRQTTKWQDWACTAVGVNEGESLLLREFISNRLADLEAWTCLAAELLGFEVNPDRDLKSLEQVDIRARIKEVYGTGDLPKDDREAPVWLTPGRAYTTLLDLFETAKDSKSLKATIEAKAKALHPEWFPNAEKP